MKLKIKTVKFAKREMHTVIFSKLSFVVSRQYASAKRPNNEVNRQTY